MERPTGPFRHLVLALMMSAANCWLPLLCVAEERLDAAWDNLPQEGLLAGEGGVGSGSITVREVWGGPNAPLAGSTSRPDDKSCMTRTINRSSAKVELKLEVRQFGADRQVIGRNSFITRLEPYKSSERTVKTKNGAIGCGLFVTGWKHLG